MGPSVAKALCVLKPLNATRPISVEVHDKAAETFGFQGIADFLHEVKVIVQVVDAIEHGAQHLAAAVEVMQIGTAKSFSAAIVPRHV